MSSPRLRAYATLALTFALGAGAGGSLVYSLVRREQAHPPRPDPGERLAALGRRLGLRPEQQAAVGAVFDRYREVRKQERARMDVPDLLAMFERTRGEKVSDDALLLG